MKELKNVVFEGIDTYLREGVFMDNKKVESVILPSYLTDTFTFFYLLKY